MQILKLTNNNLNEVVNRAKTVLESEGLVVFPSDTVYGLAANALSTRAVSKLFQFKERPFNQSISLAVKDMAQAQAYVEIDTKQAAIFQTLLPGPYTLVFKSKHQGAQQLEAEDQTLGVRIPNFGITKALSQALSFPYTATSANLHGRGPHYSIDSLLNSLSAKKQALLDLIIDAGKLPPNKTSTVINLTRPSATILRQGDFGFRFKEEILTRSDIDTQAAAQALFKKYGRELQDKALVVILQGDLGAGKTVFTKGLGKALGINNVVSPTFVIYYEYLGVEAKLHHFDLYRIETDEDLKIFNFGKLLRPNNLLVFEWGQRAGSLTSLFDSKLTKLLLIQFTDLGNNKRQLNIYEL